MLLPRPRLEPVTRAMRGRLEVVIVGVLSVESSRHDEHGQRRASA
jgi:hypothetical protein